jgi:hypothetical protein
MGSFSILRLPCSGYNLGHNKYALIVPGIKYCEKPIFYAFFPSFFLKIWIYWQIGGKRMQTVRTKIFEYGEKEINYLKSIDNHLGDAIDRIGKIERVIIPELFPALIYAIIGQQISLKAARTIWARMQERFGSITPEAVAGLPAEEIQKCGMQPTKAKYI